MPPTTRENTAKDQPTQDALAQGSRCFLIPPLSEKVAYARAQQYCARLDSHLEPEWETCLHFGCGQGFVSVLLADRMNQVLALDASPAMIARAREIAGERPGLTFEVQNEPPAPPHHPRFDCVVCNSVLQFLDDEEADAWMRWVLASLKPNGRIFLTDLMPRTSSRVQNLTHMLKWGLENKCFLAVIAEHLSLFRSGYFGMKNKMRDPEEVLDLVSKTGGQGEILPRNLEIIPARFSIAVRRI